MSFHLIVGHRRLMTAAVAAALSLVASLGNIGPAVGASDSKPLVIGHRGAPGYLPDHTLEGYRMAIAMGVDFIETDLVSTKDGVLIARHEPNIIGTTDVADHPEFASRRKTIKVDGVAETGFFTTDFTLAEIKTLRARQPLAERDQSFNGQYQIPTFDEVLMLAQERSKALGHDIGVYVETKHPTWHADLNLPLDDKMLAELDKLGWNRADAPVFIQSFETANLKALRSKTKLRLVQLVDADDVDVKTGAIIYAAPFDRPYDWTKSGRAGVFGDLLTPAGLAEVKTYADVIAPWKRYLVTVKAKLDSHGNPIDTNGDGRVKEADGTSLANDSIVQNAHALGLLVHTWTFRNEPHRLAANYANDPIKEYEEYFAMGVDGVFSDFPDTAMKARDAFWSTR